MTQFAQVDGVGGVVGAGRREPVHAGAPASEPDDVSHRLGQEVRRRARTRGVDGHAVVDLPWRRWQVLFYALESISFVSRFSPFGASFFRA